MQRQYAGQATLDRVFKIALHGVGALRALVSHKEPKKGHQVS